MKIIGGKFRGRNFFMPQWIRPTQDKLRKAVFDILGQDLEGMSFLDGFAGSGAVGLEALSRGAGKVLFVEKDTRCAALIEKNLRLLFVNKDAKESGRAEVIPSDIFSTIKRLSAREEEFDILFFDPPFRQGLAKKILKTLVGHDIVRANSLVIIQHAREETLPSQEGSFILMREKRYGLSLLTIYQKSS